MSQIEKQAADLLCLNCKKEISSTYYEILNRRELKCKKCGTLLKFNSNTVSSFRMAVHDLEYAQIKVSKSLDKIFESAEVILKR